MLPCNALQPQYMIFLYVLFQEQEPGASHRHTKSAPRVLISEEISGFQMTCRPVSFDKFSVRVVSP